MEGVTTAIVVFIFVCILFPRIVKNRTQFYAAFALVLIILLFTTLAGIIGSAGFARFVAGLSGFLTIMAFLLLVLATGGLSVKDLAGEFKTAIEVIRRGETDKEIIVPLTGEMPKPRKTSSMDDRPEVESAPPPAPPATPAAKPTTDTPSIPLE